jgi:hypothetical protein
MIGMQARKHVPIFAVIVAVLIASPGAAMAQAGTADDTVTASETVTVSLEPANESTEPGATTEYDVVVEDASAGIGSYEFDASIGDTETAVITDLSPVGTTEDDNLTSVSVAADGSSASVKAAVPDVSGTVIATLTVEGVADGTTDLTLGDIVVGDDLGTTSYTIGSVTDASVTVGSESTTDDGIEISASGDASVLPGETAELTFSLTNTGVTATAGGLQPDIPAGLSVTDVSGDGTNSPDRFYITPPATGESVETTYTLTADDNATLGTVTVSANGTFNTDSDTISATATHDIEITDATGIPDNPGFTDVLSVISAFNNNQQFNGVDVGFTDVLNTISAFNSG